MPQTTLQKKYFIYHPIRRSRIGLTPTPAQPTPSDAVRVRATLEPTKDKHAKEAGGKLKLESAASFQA